MKCYENSRVLKIDYAKFLCFRVLLSKWATGATMVQKSCC